MKTLNQFTVAELMQKNPPLVGESIGVLEAVRQMDAKKVSALIVEKEHPQDAYGILTRKDIVLEAVENPDSFFTLKVADLATKPVISIQAATGLKHAVRLMRLTGVRRLAVFEGDKLAGVISNSDIYREILRWAQAAAPKK